MKVVNQTQNTVVAENVRMADTVLSRLVGLLNTKELFPDEGLIITQCRSIHMFFMRYGIDVIFVDKKDRVVGLVRNIQPYRMSRYFIKATKAIELFPGTIDNSKTQLGDVIQYEGGGS